MEHLAGNGNGNGLLPIVDLAVDATLSQQAFHQQIKGLCQQSVPWWRDVKEEEMSVFTITGGITNTLLKVSVSGIQSAHAAHVTVRLFGPNTEAVVDRKRELQALGQLSKAGFGATLIAVFKNGMVQSFIDADTLTPEDMGKPHLVPLIAKELRRLHDTEIPISKQPQLWSDISKFLDKASSVSFADKKKQQKLESIPFSDLEDEIEILKEITDSLNAPVVFAHNDLLSGNIMFNASSGDLYFIDFEYGSYNYRGYDIGNHFNEYAGFECDFSLYPHREAQYEFFRNYLNPSCPGKASEEEMERLYVETNCYALASHLYWAIWAIVQAKFSPIQFDYLDYFFLKYKEYKIRKVEFITLALSFLAKTGQRGEQAAAESASRVVQT